MRNPCLICGSNHVESISRLTRSDLAKLWKELGRPVSETDMIRCHIGECVDLLECAGCGFQYFNPEQAGDEVFYRSLDVGKGLYYNNTRPEFGLALKLASKRSYSTVFDIGCGSGSFLDLAGKKGLKTHGLELNKQAADEAISKGHHIWKSLLNEEFLREHREKYDLVTLFQVMEHVADPVGLLSRAGKLLNKDGSIMISVPNRAGTYLLYPLDPHQWPPHHLSRWRTTDFKNLARKTGLRLRAITGDPMHGADIPMAFEANEVLKRCLGKPPSRMPAQLPRAISFIYRKLGLKYLVRNMGTSIHATFSLP